MSTTPHRRRPSLDRDTVIRAAIDLADAEGLEAVSMRRVSQALGVVPMALYKHVSDKEDLVDGMVDAVVSSFPAPPPEVAYAVGPGWRQAVRLRVAGARSALVSHPWLRRTLETRTRRTATVLAHMEAVSAAFLSGGLSPDLTHHAMHALGTRIWGFSPELFDESRSGPTPARHTGAAPQPSDYPSIVAIAADAKARRPGATGCDEDFEFSFAFELILGAVDCLHATGWASGDPLPGASR